MSTQPYLNGGNVLRIGGLVEKDGMPTPRFQLFLNDLQTRVGIALGELGVLIGNIAATATVQGRQGTIAAALSNITATGLLNAPFLTGVVPAVNLPSSQIGAHGAVQAIAAVAHQFLNSIGTNGIPTLLQPAFTDISGQATAAQVPNLNLLNGAVTAGQVPNLSALNGQITTAQLPASGLSVTITTAKLTTGGTQGSMTFTNGILTAQTAAT